MTHSFCRSAPFRLALAAGVCAIAVGASAQGVYRIVGPDGKVSFSDRPPADAKSVSAAGTASGSTSGGQALPYALQQVVNKFPVTLYTASGCSPCDQARTLLTQRGVPFTEKTVNTNEDIAAFNRQTQENSLPLGMVGAQPVKGFSEREWNSYLDAAGYPKQSALPPSYRQPAGSPLVPLKTAADAPSTANTPATSSATGGASSNADARKRPPTPARPPANDPSNPAGIRF